MVVVRPYRCSSLITGGGQRHRKNSNQDFGRDFTYSRRCASAAIPTGSTHRLASEFVADASRGAMA